MASRQIVLKSVVPALIFGAFVFTLQAADTNAALTVKARIGAAEKQVREKNYGDAEKTLLALEKEKGLDDAAKSLVCRQLMILYGAKSDAAKQAEYARKIAALPAAGVQQKTEALSALAAMCDIGSRFNGYYMELKLDKKDLERMEKEELGYRGAMPASRPGMRPGQPRHSKPR